MRPPEPLARERGFSLVELLVAMLFVSLLMAGLAQVFKGSLSSFVTASERISAGRQSKLALEQLADDLLYAGSTPTSLIWAPPSVTSANPAFAIVPNVSYPNTNDPTHLGDQLFLYYDQILPFQATMDATLLGTANLVSGGYALGYGNGFKIDFSDPGQASAAATAVTGAINAGMTPMILFQSQATPQQLSALAADGTVTLTTTFTSRYSAPQGSVVNLIIQGEYIRYSIQPLLLDPANPTTYTPCLVRDLIPYPGSSAAVWTSPVSSTIIAENVTAFHVGLSADGGKSWAGTTAAGAWSTTSAAWTDITGPDNGAAAPTLNYQLANLNTGMNPVPSVNQGGSFWFRNYPCLVRLDITTRTRVQRAENVPNAPGQPVTAGYNYQTRTLILNPRHFGLAF